jgi:cell division protein FtsB
MILDTQQLINSVLVIASGVTGWFARELWNAVKELKQDLAKLREEMPKDYVMKEDYRRDIYEIKEYLSKIFDRLDNKADK